MKAVALEDIAPVKHSVVVAKQHIAGLHGYTNDVLLAYLGGSHTTSAINAPREIKGNGEHTRLISSSISPGMMDRSPKNTSVMPT